MRMSSVGRLAACLVLAGGTLSAQQHRAPVGIEIGYSQADLVGAQGAPSASRQGALAGVYLTGRLGSILAIQPELLFALKGGRILAAIDSGAAAPVDIELAYLEMPVLAKVAIMPTYRRAHPVIFGGMAPAIRIGCDLAQRAACEDVKGLTFKRMDVGAVVGAGLHFDWADAALGLEARYTLGLSSVFEDGADVRNRQLGIMLALNF